MPLYPPFISLYFLNLTNSPSYSKYGSELLHYIWDLQTFLQNWMLKQFNHSAVVQWYSLNPRLNAFEDLRKFDQLPNLTGLDYFSNHIQVYLTYGQYLPPPNAPPDVRVGYCELSQYKDGKLDPAHLISVPMEVFEPRVPIGKNPYAFYADTCKQVTHEIEHQLANLTPGYRAIGSVHDAARTPKILWSKDCKTSILLVPDAAVPPELERDRKTFVSQQSFLLFP